MKKVVVKINGEEYEISYTAKFESAAWDARFMFNAVIDDRLKPYVDSPLSFHLAPTGRNKKGSISYRRGGDVFTNVNGVKSDILSSLINAERLNIWPKQL